MKKIIITLMITIPVVSYAKGDGDLVDKIEQFIKLAEYFGWGVVLFVILLFVGLKNYIPKKIAGEVNKKIQLEVLDIERRKNFKKEVYAEIMDGITKIHTSISMLANQKITSEEVSKRLSAGEAMVSKMYVVSDEEAVQTLIDFNSEVGITVMDLLQKKQKLFILEDNISILNIAINESDQIVDNWNTLISEISSGLGNDVKYQAYSLAREQEIEKRKTCIDEREKQQKEHQDYLEEYTNLCMTKFFETSKKIPPLILAIRKELDMKIDEEKFTELYTNNINKGYDCWQDFMQNLKSSA